MALIKCHECGSEVSTEAAACPRCGAKPKRNASPLFIFILASLFFVVFFTIFLGKNDDEPTNAPAASVPPPVTTPADSVAKENPIKAPEKPQTDYTRALYTTSHAIVCPYGILVDKREGHGLEGANQAAVSVFSRSEKVKEAGCEEWKAGIRIYISPEKADWSWQEFAEYPGQPIERFILKFDVTNDSGQLTQDPA